MRLNRYLAACGLGSRRAVEDFIRDRRVVINGVVEETLGRDILESDRVEVDGKTVRPDSHEYLLLHKPAGVVTTMFDTHERPTVADLMHGDKRLFPVGRLDVDTSGLLVMTNDGEFANRLSHPRYGVTKTYEALVRGIVSEENLRRLASGVELDDGMTAPATVKLQFVRGNQTCIELVLHEGRNRQVRRMCDVIGHHVDALRRTAYGDLTLGMLAPGKARPINRKELAGLRRATGGS